MPAKNNQAHLTERRENVELYNVEIREVDGCSRGIVAVKDLEPGTTVLQVPFKLTNPFEKVLNTLSGASRMCQFAAQVAYDDARLAKFDVEAFPLTWPEDYQQLLPSKALVLLDEQQQNFENDWKKVQCVYKGLKENHFKTAWLYIYSHTFYVEDIHPHLFYIPVAEYFNFSDRPGCKMDFENDGVIRFITMRPHAKGEELRIANGLTNDQSLVHFGFLPKEDLIVPRDPSLYAYEQTDRDQDYFTRYQKEMDACTVQDAKEKLERILNLPEDNQYAKRCLRRRWEQIEAFAKWLVGRPDT